MTYVQLSLILNTLNKHYSCENNFAVTHTRNRRIDKLLLDKLFDKIFQHIYMIFTVTKERCPSQCVFQRNSRKLIKYKLILKKKIFSRSINK